MPRFPDKNQHASMGNECVGMSETYLEPPSIIIPNAHKVPLFGGYNEIHRRYTKITESGWVLIGWPDRLITWEL